MRQIRASFKPVLYYLLLGITWIIVTDFLAAHLDQSSKAYYYLQVCKGIVFVMLSAGLLFLLIRRELVRQAALQSKLTEAELSLYVFAEKSPVLFYIYSLYPERRFKYVSPSCFEITGYTQQEHYDDPDLGRKTIHPEDAAKFQSYVSEDTGDKKILMRWYHKNGSIYYTEQTNVLIKDNNGNLTAVTGFALDVTERIKQENEIQKFTLSYNTLSKINRLIVREHDTSKLLARACEIALQNGNFDLAWIGSVDHHRGIIEVESYAGDGHAYINSLQIKLDDPTLGNGPSARAVKTNKPAFSFNIATDPFMQPWRDHALAAGYCSSAAYPVVVRGTVEKVLNLYSSEENYFSGDVSSVYEELASDIGFALEQSINLEERNLFLRNLEASEKIRELILRMSPAVLFRFSEYNKKFVADFVSPNAEKLFGYRAEEFLKPDFFMTVVHPAEKPKLENAFASVPEKHEIRLELRVMNQQKRYFWIQADFRHKPAEGNNHAQIFCSILNIDKQKIFQQALQKSQERWQFAIEGTGDGLWDWNLSTGEIYYSDQLKKMLGYETLEFENTPEARTNIIHNDDKEKYTRDLKQYLEGHTETFTSEVRLQCKDGSYKWVLDRGKITSRDENNKPLRMIGLHVDITERKIREERMKLDSAIISSTRDGVMITDLGPRIISVNKAYTDITGYLPEEVIGKNPNILKSGQHSKEFYQEFWHDLKTTGQWQGEIFNRRKSGEIYIELASINVVNDDKGNPEYYVGVFTDISKLKKSEEEYARLAHFDLLTGLPNRLMVNNRLDHAIEQSARTGDRLAVLFLDLDHFKNINDALGHTAGDDLLVQVAGRLSKRIREEDTFGRLGGDEFVIIMETITNDQSPAVLAHDLLALITEPFRVLTSNEIYISGSIGITLYPEDGKTAHDLIQHADAALYLAKSQGRNTFRYYTASLTAAANRRIELEAAIRHGIEHHEFAVWYQPLVDMKTDKVIGAEALVRWPNKTGQVAYPDEFIPLAEETGLIIRLGEQIFETAARQAKAWHEKKNDFATMAINTSFVQFRRKDFLHRIKMIIEQNQVDPALLEIEITESGLMEKLSGPLDTFTEMKNLGLRIAIDDFGTGYSSLSYLQQFPVNKLKIDRSFVSGLPESLSSAQIVTTIIAMAKGLGLSVLGEGVETAAQREFLMRAGCVFYQGYLKGPAIPPAEFEKKYLS